MPSKKKIAKAALATNRAYDLAQSRSKEIPDSSSEPETPGPPSTGKGSNPKHTTPIVRGSGTDGNVNYNGSVDLDTPQRVTTKPSKDETKKSKYRQPRYEATISPAFQPKYSKKAKRSLEETPSPNTKRQRTTRGKVVNYDLRYHPMDIVTKPNAAATRRAICGQTDRKASFDSVSTLKNTETVIEGSEDDEDDQEVKSTNTSHRGISNPVVDSGRRRSSHHPKEGPPNYSTKWHPMDNFTRPNACRQGKSKIKIEPANSINDLTRSQSPVLKPSYRPKEALETKLAYQDIAHPDRRRSSRNTYTEEIALKNDLRHHPLDNFTRPKAVAKLRQQKSRHATVPDPPRKPAAGSMNHPPKGLGARINTDAPIKPLDGTKESVGGDEGSTGKGTPHGNDPKQTQALEDPPATAVHRDTFSKLFGEALQAENSELPALQDDTPDWNRLSGTDRRLFLLQKGAPLQGDTLPLDWSTVKKVLFGEGYNITLDVVNSDEGTKMIQARYEELRVGVEAYFSARSDPANKKDWTVLRAEGFDAFDKKKGIKYWKYTEHSIAKPIEAKEDETPRDSTVGVVDDGQGQAARTGSRGDQSTFGKQISAPGIEIEGSLPTSQTRQEPYLQSGAPDVGSFKIVCGDAEAMSSGVTMRADAEDHTLVNEPDSQKSSEKTLIELVGTSQPVLLKAPAGNDMSIDDIEALLNEERPTQDRQLHATKSTLVRIEVQENFASATLQPAFRASSSTGVVSKKRKKRKSAADFIVFEDDPNEMPMGSGLVSPKTDLPVENMSSQELVHLSQHSTTDGVPNTYRRHDHHHSSQIVTRSQTDASRFSPRPRSSLFGGLQHAQAF